MNLTATCNQQENSKRMSGEYWPFGTMNNRILYKKISQEIDGESWYVYKINSYMKNTNAEDARWSLFFTKENESKPERKHIRNSDEGIN